jgi:hypothetical protein
MVTASKAWPTYFATIDEPRTHTSHRRLSTTFSRIRITALARMVHGIISPPCCRRAGDHVALAHVAMADGLALSELRHLPLEIRTPVYHDKHRAIAPAQNAR